MICGKRLNRIWLAPALLLLLLSAISPAAADQCETDLMDCVTRLEIAINERESMSGLLIESRTLINQQQNLISTQGILNTDLMMSLSERDERLKMIEILLIESDANKQRAAIIATIKGTAIGIGIGVPIGALVLSLVAR